MSSCGSMHQSDWYDVEARFGADLDQLVPLFLQRLELGQAFAKRQGNRGSRQGGERRRSGERFSHEEKTLCQSRYV
jgi:hypothetical protein